MYIGIWPKKKKFIKASRQIRRWNKRIRTWFNRSRLNRLQDNLKFCLRYWFLISIGVYDLYNGYTQPINACNENLSLRDCYAHCASKATCWSATRRISTRLWFLCSFPAEMHTVTERNVKSEIVLRHETWKIAEVTGGQNAFSAVELFLKRFALWYLYFLSLSFLSFNAFRAFIGKRLCNYCELLP